jgi:hypothetical protein
MPRISSHCSTLRCDFFKFPSARHLLMIVHDADDVVRAEELPVWPLDHKTSAASWLDGNSLTGLATLLALSYSSYLIYLIAITYFAPKRALAKRLLRYGYGKTAAQI